MMKSMRDGWPGWLGTLGMIVVLATPAQASAPADGADPALARAIAVLDSTILFDGHNDLPMVIRRYAPAPGDVIAYDLRTHTPGETDIERLRAGRVGAQFWSVYIPGEGRGPFTRPQLDQIELTLRIIERYPDVLTLATTAAEVRAAREKGLIASLLGMEGGYGIENSLDSLRAFHRLGVRYMALTHNAHTDWADAAVQIPPRHGGLTDFGKEIVREMNRLGMIIDLSHAAPSSMADTLDLTEAPIMFSHSSARGLCDVPRNVPDEILRRMPKNGGVVMVTFVAGFINCEVGRVLEPAMAELSLRARAAKSDSERSRIMREGLAAIEVPVTTISMVADHIEYVRDVAGIDHVGIGGDFDGNPRWPEGLSDVSMYPALFAELVRRGWSDDDLRKLAGENMLRVMEGVERVAARLQTERPPSTRVFEP